MADGIFPGLVSKDRDANALDNPIFVQLSDGAEIALVDASGNLNVILAANSGVDIGDVDVISVIPGVAATNLGKAVDTAGGATDTGVATLALRDDALTTLTPVDGDYVRLRVDSTGALWVNTGTPVASADVHVDDSAFTVGTDSVGAAGYLADETTPDSVDEGDVGIARMTLDRKQLNVIVDATTDSQRLAINATGEAQVDVAAHALTNANAVPVSKDNSANSETNPIWVQNTDASVSGTEVQDFDTTASVAADGADNHDYTVTGTTFLLSSVIVSMSGNGKFEIQVGPLATLVTKAVGFLTGREGDTKQVNFSPAIEVPITGTGTVRVIRTNRENQTQDVYSTIIGKDV